MTTLIAVYNSDGCVGRCDAKCYNAESPDCDCICGGMNHGAGKPKAIDNTREYANEMLEQYGQRIKFDSFMVPAKQPQQIDLF